MKVAIICSILMSLMAGCSQPKAGRTNLPSYVAAQLESISGKQFKSVPAAELSDVEWEKKEDSGGVKIIVKGNHFDAIDSMFQGTLRKPYEVTTNELGYPSVTYHVRQHGVAVTYEVRDDKKDYPKSVFILLLKPVRF